MTEWDAEANSLRANVFKIISEAWPILKDIREFHDLLSAADIAATPDTRITVAPQTSWTKGKSRTSEHRRKPRQESPNKGVNKESEQTGWELRRKRRNSKTPRSDQSRPKWNRREETNQSVPLDADTSATPTQKLQELVMSFKGLRFSQVKKLKDDNVLRV